MDIYAHITPFLMPATLFAASSKTKRQPEINIVRATAGNRFKGGRAQKNFSSLHIVPIATRSTSTHKVFPRPSDPPPSLPPSRLPFSPPSFSMPGLFVICLPPGTAAAGYFYMEAPTLQLVRFLRPLSL